MSEAPTLTERISSFIQAGQNDQAEELARSHWTQHSSDPEAIDLYASTLYRLNRNRDLTASLALQVYNSRPFNMERLRTTARCLMLACRAEDSETLLYKELQRQPYNFNIQLELAYHRCLQGKFDSAELILRNILAREPSHLVAQATLGWYNIYNGNRSEGIEQIHLGRRLFPWGSYAVLPREKQWNRELPLPKGEKIQVIGEGGAGDCLLGLGLLQNFICRYSIPTELFIRQDLLRIARRTLPDSVSIRPVEQVQTSAITNWVGLFDVACFHDLKSTPVVQTPYLRADPARVEKFRQEIALHKKNFRRVMGLRWSGDSAHDFEAHRRLPQRHLEAFVARHPDILFIPVYHAAESYPRLSLRENILDLSSSIVDWEDTLALCASVDGTITSCTSVAHASAGLGQPTNVLLMAWPYFVWAQPTNGDSYWYGPHVQITRQKSYLDWSPVFKSLSASLETNAHHLTVRQEAVTLEW